jgi:hypothetical protein
MMWNGNKVTDHNRSALAISTERIEDSQRMANGTMRKYVVADKRTFSTDWDNLPHNAMFTVDGFWGKNEMQNFYNTTPGPFPMVVTWGDGTTDTITVMMTKFEATLDKRGAYDMWKVSVELQEV